MIISSGRGYIPETLEREILRQTYYQGEGCQEIGEKIIDFLAQIEDFQKRLWEKKKFVLTTEYVITTDMVPEILSGYSQEQGTAEGMEGAGLEAVKSSDELKEKKMPIDTQHFRRTSKTDSWSSLLRQQTLMICLTAW